MRTTEAVDTAVVLAAVAGTTALAAAGLVPVAARLAGRFGIVDQPGHRKVHETPTPRLGGLAIFLPFTLVILAGYLLLPELLATPWAQSLFPQSAHMLRQAHLVEGKLLALLAGGTLVFAVGVVDDTLQGRFPFWAKLIGQVLAALVLIGAGVRTAFLPGDLLNAALTLVWLVGITNAFNLIDNMDGICAGVALVACGVLLANAYFLGEFFVSLVLVSLMGALLGFLFFNFNPASVFLGDCGSLFIGYVLASLTLLERYISTASNSLFPVLMPVLVLALPIMDTTTVVVIRLREGRPIYQGDKRHLTHRLGELGFGPRAVALYAYLVTACLGLGSLLLVNATLRDTAIILLWSAGLVASILLLMFVPRRPAAGDRAE